MKKREVSQAGKVYDRPRLPRVSSGAGAMKMLCHATTANRWVVPCWGTKSRRGAFWASWLSERKLNWPETISD